MLWVSFRTEAFPEDYLRTQGAENCQCTLTALKNRCPNAGRGQTGNGIPVVLLLPESTKRGGL